MSNDKKTLYERLGGYDAIAAVANDLLPRLRADPQLVLGASRGRRRHAREAAPHRFPLRERGRTDVLSRPGHGAHPPRHLHQ